MARGSSNTLCKYIHAESQTYSRQSRTVYLLPMVLAWGRGEMLTSPVCIESSEGSKLTHLIRRFYCALSSGNQAPIFIASRTTQVPFSQQPGDSCTVLFPSNLFKGCVNARTFPCVVKETVGKERRAKRSPFWLSMYVFAMAAHS